MQTKKKEKEIRMHVDRIISLCGECLTYNVSTVRKSNNISLLWTDSTQNSDF